jgi:hypothetical protein
MTLAENGTGIPLLYGTGIPVDKIGPTDLSRTAEAN